MRYKLKKEHRVISYKEQTNMQSDVAYTYDINGGGCRYNPYAFEHIDKHYFDMYQQIFKSDGSSNLNHKFEYDNNGNIIYYTDGEIELYYGYMDNKVFSCDAVLYGNHETHIDYIYNCDHLKVTETYNTGQSVSREYILDGYKILSILSESTQYNYDNDVLISISNTQNGHINSYNYDIVKFLDYRDPNKKSIPCSYKQNILYLP